MTPSDRLSLTLRLRELLDQAGALFEDIATGVSDRALVASADELVNRAGAVLAQAASVSLEAERADAGISGLLSDKEPIFLLNVTIELRGVRRDAIELPRG
jgi:hypothetical protein